MLNDTFEEEIRDDELDLLKEMKIKVNSFQSKVEHEEKQLEKTKLKLSTLTQKKEELNHYDIYDLDSFLKKQQDFMNNLDISLYKLNDMAKEVKKRYNG